MPKLAIPASSPCLCRRLHTDCDPRTCTQARHAHNAGRTSLKELRKSAQRGCQTCAAVVNALLVPQVREAWRVSIVPALKSSRSRVVRELASDEEEIRIEFDPAPGPSNGGRRIIRTRASDESADWRHFNIWREDPDVSLSDNKRCRAIQPLKYHPGEHTGSSQALEQLKSWMETCEKNHSCSSKEDPVLPTRVVQVTRGRVKVVETDGARARYVALSHRWGPQESFILTTSSMKTMTQNLPWHTIPRTYRDAIEVTQQLGIKYIWIDTLCIVQDDPEDWHRQSVRMASVYGNSYLTISAAHSTASDTGIFTPSHLSQQFPQHSVPEHPGIYIREQPHWRHTDFGSNYSAFYTSRSLMKRGWVLQERLLSPRVVYYDAEEMKWECKSMTDCQCGGMVVISNFKRDYHGSVDRGETPLSHSWMRVTERYSCLDLTFEKDRLVALAGIATAAGKSGSGGKYLAGVWEKNLAHQLCWSITRVHRKPETYIAPSWSWMSIHGPISYQNRMDFGLWCTRIDVNITQAECDTGEHGAGGMGPVVGGFLKLDGRGVRMDAKLAEPGSETTPPAYELHHSSGADLGYLIQMDYTMTPAQAMDVKAVFILFWGNIEPRLNTFLVLREVPDRERTFERLGIFWYDSSEDEEFFQVLGWCQPEKDIIMI